MCKKVLHHEKDDDNLSLTQLMMLFLESHMIVFHPLVTRKIQTTGSSNNGESFGIIDLFTKEAKYLLIA